jgi:hypothetical protein
VGGNGGFGGYGGSGGGGGYCGTGFTSKGGDGAEGGDGADGGDGGGGAIDSLGHATVAGVTFTKDTVGGGIVGPDCTNSPYGPGCAGIGGTGGPDFPTGMGDSGNDGNDGKPGNGIDPDSSVKPVGLAAVKVVTKSLPKAEKGSRYRASLKAAGGITPYHWTVSDLPKGLKASTAGVISGKAASTGVFHVRVTVTDPGAAQRSTGKARLTLKVSS